MTHLLIPVISLLSITTHAEELDAASQSALGQTQQLLTDPKARQKEIDQNQSAAKADQNLKATGLSHGSQDRVYGLSSEIFEQITKAAQGDPAKMNKILSDFQSNPESIRPYLSESQLKEIKGLGKEIEAPKKKAP